MTNDDFLDARWQQLAEILTNYSVAVGPGNRVLLTMLETGTFPLIRAVHAHVIQAGGYPQIEFQSACLERDLLVLGGEDQVAWVPELSRSGLEWADVYIGVRGASSPRMLRDVTTARISAHSRAMGILSALRTEKTRWVLVVVPNEEMALRAGMSLDGMMGMFFDAVLKDWRKEAKEYRRFQSLFEGTSRIRIVGPGTDLCFDTRGRLFHVEDGHINMPGGELFTSPLEDSAEGTISFSFPGVFAGQTVEGIVLGFAGGKVVSARARTNEELLGRLIGMDLGASRIGEFGIGLNRAIDRCCYTPLYDEKIWGTVHIALGRSYSVCGGTNQSALHWDLVTDLREQGEIHSDGRLVFGNGSVLG